MKNRLRTAGAAVAVLSCLLHAPAALCQRQRPNRRPESREQWFRDGSETVARLKRAAANPTRAKNVILFVGDGMGITTITAARILEGQRRGASGEENALSFERLPYLALSKTYSANQQTSDSAPTMTAMVTGVKTDEGVLSVDQNVARGDHTTAAGNELTTILELAEDRGLATGVVSTSEITDATPAACYSHSPERGWMDDASLSAEARAANFPDIARQLIEFRHGDGLEVVLGGGRSRFLPKSAADPEDPGAKGNRLDNRDLAAEWTGQRPRSAYVWNKKEFDRLDPRATDRVIGLFERGVMEYEHDRPRDAGGEPSLSEMTSKAIDIVAKNPRGYFLMVEGGRIDHAHHAGNAYRALTDAIELSNAVRTAQSKVDLSETLIIVTADHSHTLNISGYPTRGNDILGKVRGNDDRGEPEQADSKDLLGLPYTTLSYANGRGYTGPSPSQPEGSKRFPHEPKEFRGITSGRPDLSDVDTGDPNYMQEAVVPLGSETHGGEDVVIFAGGPGAHLFRGVLEQNVIFHVMADALRLNGRGHKTLSRAPRRKSAASRESRP